MILVSLETFFHSDDFSPSEKLEEVIEVPSIITETTIDESDKQSSAFGTTEDPSTMTQTATEVIHESSTIIDLMTETNIEAEATESSLSSNSPSIKPENPSINQPETLTLSTTQNDVIDDPNTSEKSSKSFSIPLIIGLIIGILALIAIIIIIIILIRRKKQNNRQEQTEGSTIEMNQSQDSISAQEFDNPLYYQGNIDHDPFDQNFDEDI